MEYIIFGMILVLIALFLVVIYLINNDNKRLNSEIERWKEDYKQRTFESHHWLAEVKELKKTIKHLQTPEHELQGEFEADDETYNRIIDEWINGAQEEGGLDGE